MIKAKYIGRDSLGFLSGKVYEISTSVENVDLGSHKKMCLVEKDKKSGNSCPYDRLEAFLKYWKVVYVGSGR